MPTMKSRITALDWARATALGQLKSLVAKYATEGPSEWSWRVGRLVRDDPNVVVTVVDAELGMTASHLVQMHLPYLRLEEEIKYLFEKIAFQRHCAIATLDLHRKRAQS